MIGVGDRSGCGEPGLLATDLYQLTMLHAYRQAGMTGRAVFEFFCRRLPPSRGFLLVAGVETLLKWLETARFTVDEIAWLRSTGRFPAEFVDSLSGWRFSGDVDAMPEGSLAFAGEPILRIEAPMAEAQLVETAAINFVHFQTLIASKAARMVLAAPSKPLIDFGLRRAHSLEAGILAARAAYLAGFAGTTSVLAGKRFAIPLFGTMAHSFVQAHDSEADAFLHFAKARPADTTFLIDTYDTEAAARTLVVRAEQLRAAGAEVDAVRIDSGDLAAHARAVRHILDQGGLRHTRIVASGGLDEWALRALVAAGAPIDAYGIGTSLTTSADQPALDCAYKLVSYAGKPRRKLSEGKPLWPGAKQVYRRSNAAGRLTDDMVTLADEDAEGEPVLVSMMRGGRRLAVPPLSAARGRAEVSLASLPDAFRDLDRPSSYPVEISTGIRQMAAGMPAPRPHG